MTRDRSATPALVLGLLSLLFGVLAPFAIWSGIVCLHRIRSGPGNLTGENSAWVGLIAAMIGITFAAIGIVFWVLVS
ncbi:MAG TPA: hypothetical protein VET26_03660 [Candidatus Sulfotelmatobacter sp.]|nr:hypothetical protein [Candidatus Sulfotelmatobacter sp.]